MQPHRSNDFAFGHESDELAIGVDYRKSADVVGHHLTDGGVDMSVWLDGIHPFGLPLE
jgi:hypothetical protein